jgi:hypothetical protein
MKICFTFAEIFFMINEGLIEQLIEDVKKFAIIKNNTKNHDQVMAQMSMYAGNPQNNQPASTLEFVVATNCSIEIPGGLKAIAKLINGFKEIFTLENDNLTSFNLFLRELEDSKKEIAELMTTVESKVFVDISTGRQGNLPYSYLKAQLEHTHRDVAATYNNYLAIASKK